MIGDEDSIVEFVYGVKEQIGWWQGFASLAAKRYKGGDKALALADSEGCLRADCQLEITAVTEILGLSVAEVVYAGSM